MDKKTISTPIMISIDILNFFRKFIIIFVIVYAIFLVTSYPEIEITVDNIQSIDNDLLQKLLYILSIVGLTSYIFLYLLVKEGEVALKSILDNNVFDIKVINSLNKCYKLLLIYYIITAITTLSFQWTLLSLVVVVGIVKEVFVYGNKLEEEISTII